MIARHSGSKDDGSARVGGQVTQRTTVDKVVGTFIGIGVLTELKATSFCLCGQHKLSPFLSAGFGAHRN
jgi:hypothetical protein